MIQITALPAFTDNYIWMLHDGQRAIVVDPGETKKVTFKVDKSGVYPYYCTNFCSALHQEMQGYLIVNRRGAVTTTAAGRD